MTDQIDPERLPGSMFDVPDLGWFDFETRSPVDISCGAYRYACHDEAAAIVLAYAIGDGPVQVVSVASFDTTLDCTDLPPDFMSFHDRVVAGEGKWVAWNAGFDKAIWNYAAVAFPELKPEHVLDAMVQATASGLPPDLAMASRLIGRSVKVGDGKDLIKLFCTPGGLKGVCGTPQSHPEDWETFRGVYAPGDIEAMRDVFKATRRLPLAEWREYWAAEEVNERGVGIDVPMCEAAAALAAEDKIRSGVELAHITSGEVTTVDQVKRIMDWLLPRLPPDGQKILIKRAEEVDDDGIVTRPAKNQLTRKQIERLLAYLAETDLREQGADMVRVLQIRQYGGSKTPAKFQKMVDSHVGGVLYGQYVFNGASQTGRASSRGVQIHNLARDSMKAEPELIEGLLGGANYGDFSRTGDDSPVARKLSLLIRPAFVPGPGNAFVWSDWSQIEARVLPWLCDHYKGAAERLDIFRAVDADPSVPDIYTRTAAKLSGLSIEEVTKSIRQRGKVAELALGFCGGVGALQAMGASYGLHLSDDDARIIVDKWRADNSWAINFSREIWEAMRFCSHRDNFGQRVPVGRMWLKYDPAYLGGTLLARLPSGRIITYRAMRWQDIDVLDEDDKPTGEKKTELMFSRGYGRVKLWPGMFVENFTQAAAADFLRGTLVRLVDAGFNVRLHTHDEILCEVEDILAAPHANALREVMQEGFPWSEGLPLMSDETMGYCYTKDEGSTGL